MKRGGGLRRYLSYNNCSSDYNKYFSNYEFNTKILNDNNLVMALYNIAKYFQYSNADIYQVLISQIFYNEMIKNKLLMKKSNDGKIKYESIDKCFFTNLKRKLKNVYKGNFNSGEQSFKNEFSSKKNDSSSKKNDSSSKKNGSSSKKNVDLQDLALYGSEIIQLYNQKASASPLQTNFQTSDTSPFFTQKNNQQNEESTPISSLGDTHDSS